MLEPVQNQMPDELFPDDFPDSCFRALDEVRASIHHSADVLERFERLYGPALRAWSEKRAARAALLSPSLKTAREDICRNCGVPLGGQHRPSCPRQGVVSTESCDGTARDPSSAERAAVAELARARATPAEAEAGRLIGWKDHAATPAEVDAAKPPYFGGSTAFRLWLVRMGEISVRSFHVVRLTEQYIIFQPYADVEAIWCRRCLTASTRPNDVVRRYCSQCQRFHDEPEGNWG